MGVRRSAHALEARWQRPSRRRATGFGRLWGRRALSPAECGRILASYSALSVESHVSWTICSGVSSPVNASNLVASMPAARSDLSKSRRRSIRRARLMYVAS